MSKNIQLTIADPCHENWDQMTQAEQGRYCASCQKQVMDFTNMSDSQLAAFFKKPTTGSVCGRFYEDQLERDIEIPRKRIPWVKYFFQFVLPAFLISAKVSAQGKVKIKKTDILMTPTTPQVMGFIGIPQNSISSIHKTVIRGKVIDKNNNPVLYASITLKGSGLGVYADTSGMFMIEKVLTQTNFILEVIAVGYESKEVTVNRQTDLNKDIIIQLEPVTIPNESIPSLMAPLTCRSIVVGGMSFSRSPNKANRIPIKPDTLKVITEKIEVISLAKSPEEIPPVIKVYPNPVVSGTNINVGCQKMKEGYYVVQLSNQSGQQVLNKQTWIDGEAQVLNIDIPIVATGVYFLKLTNKETNKRFTAKVVIE
jgi:CarboxypepD_reg-like domain/Secretion system C-terminal sorting domain